MNTNLDQGLAVPVGWVNPFLDRGTAEERRLHYAKSIADDLAHAEEMSKTFDYWNFDHWGSLEDAISHVGCEGGSTFDQLQYFLTREFFRLRDERDRLLEENVRLKEALARTS